MWQEYVIHKDNMQYPPHDYTGLWKIWSEDGYLMGTGQYDKGSLRQNKRYNSNGDLILLIDVMDKKSISLKSSRFYDSGKLKEFSLTDELSGTSTVGTFAVAYLENGDLTDIVSISHGSVVKVYSLKKHIDLRHQYAKEIKELEDELAKFKKKHGIK